MVDPSNKQETLKLIPTPGRMNPITPLERVGREESKGPTIGEKSRENAAQGGRPKEGSNEK